MVANCFTIQYISDGVVNVSEKEIFGSILGLFVCVF